MNLSAINRTIGITLCGLLINSSALADSTKIQTHAAIEASAAEFATSLAAEHGKQAQINIKVDPLDKRLRLGKCSVPLEAFESPNSRSTGRTTVGVRCNGDKSWKLYVPVTIEVIRKVATIRSGVTRNSQLQAADIIMQEQDISGMHQGYFTNKQAVIGKHVKTSLKGGTVLKPKNLENPLAIEKGTLVTILADLGGITVRMKGKALKSGSVGDWIAVENISSSRKVEGKILDDGIVQVML